MKRVKMSLFIKCVYNIQQVTLSERCHKKKWSFQVCQKVGRFYEKLELVTSSPLVWRQSERDASGRSYVRPAPTRRGVSWDSGQTSQAFRHFECMKYYRKSLSSPLVLLTTLLPVIFSPRCYVEYICGEKLPQIINGCSYE